LALGPPYVHGEKVWVGLKMHEEHVWIWHKTDQPGRSADVRWRG